MRMHFTPVLLVLLLVSCVQSHDVDLFENARHEGNKTTLHVTNCSNLPADAINKASSVNTHGRCTKFYDELDCKGHFIKIPTRSSFHHDLINWKFNDRINSVGICTDPCIPEEGQSFSKQRTNSSAFRIVLYEKPHFKGKSYPIEVDGCTPVNENVRKLRMLADTGSVRIPEGKCALVYVDSGNRDGDWNEANCSVDNEFNVFELRDGIPSLNNFGNWGVTLQYIRSVSPCQCQRSSYSDKNFTLDKPTFTGNESLLDNNSLWLYRRNNFREDPVKIPLNLKGCIDLSVGEYRAWEGVAASMYISPGSCIAVHKDHDCNDAFSVEFKRSVPDLSEYNFDSAIRSLSTCSTEVAELSESCENLVLYILFLVGFLMICIVLFIALGLMLKRKYKSKYKTIMETLTDKEIDEFLQGLGLELEDESDNVSVSDCRAASIAELGNETESLKFSSDLLAQNQPYNFQLEIPRTQLNYDIKCALGSGEYGIVYKGTLEKANINIPVAIKTMKPYSNGEGLRALLKEVKVMMYVGQHPKIVKLEGCCTNNLRQGELLIVTEYCENGSLERYLKANRSNFLNYVQKGKIQTQTPEIKNSYSCYMKVMPSLGTSIKQDAYNRNKFDTIRLIAWSIEIAEGMDYLASKRVIHGDLSARNVLLSPNLTAKISDFGLSRKMYGYSQYTRNSHEHEALPWRWLALESLKNLEFSTASDVWSWGILAWEIFSLGEQPYPGVSSMTNNFVINLEQGLRPTIPPYATSDCYNIMSSCWDENPKQRPSFSTLRSSLSEIQEVCKTKISLCSSTTKVDNENETIGYYQF